MHFKKLLTLALAATTSAQTLLQALQSQNASLSTLIGLLSADPTLLNTVGGLSNITLLAPSNTAIDRFLSTPAGIAAATDPFNLAAVLTYHILNGTYNSTAFTAQAKFLPSVLNNSTYSNITGGQVVKGYLNGTQVDIVSGGLAKSVVTTADVGFTGGVIHIIDTVLSLPLSVSTTATAAGLTSLASALNATSLIPTVNSLRDVTVFAPTNAAFAAIANVTSNLTVAQISSILTYHVVQGTVGYSTLLSNTSLTTVNGAQLTIRLINGGVFVNGARVVQPDVLVNSGVVHVIDSVLTPAQSTQVPNPTATAAPTGSAAATSTRPTSTSFSAGAAVPTGAIGVGALFGIAAVVGNL